MVEALARDGCGAGEPCLHVIGNSERSEEVDALEIREFGGCQNSAQVVRRVAGLRLGDVTVGEIEVAGECGVVEGSPLRCGGSTADQRARPGHGNSSCSARMASIGAAVSAPMAHPMESRTCAFSFSLASADSSK